MKTFHILFFLCSSICYGQGLGDFHSELAQLIKQNQGSSIVKNKIYFGVDSSRENAAETVIGKKLPYDLYPRMAFLDRTLKGEPSCVMSFDMAGVSEIIVNHLNKREGMDYRIDIYMKPDYLSVGYYGPDLPIQLVNVINLYGTFDLVTANKIRKMLITLAVHNGASLISPDARKN